MESLAHLVARLLVLLCLVSATVAVAPREAEAANGCTGRGHSIVIDRARQRAWLCDGSRQVGQRFPITTQRYQPNPATYRVFSKSPAVRITFNGRAAVLDWWVGFTYGRFTGRTIGLHGVPRYVRGGYGQPLSTVGTMAWFGRTGGCIRLVPAQARVVYGWLSIGSRVVVIS
jgi:hypothetical protein